MSRSRGPFAAYPDADGLEARIDELARSSGVRASVAGTSAEGRPLRVLELGPEGAPVVLLTGLMHAVEVIGGLALLSLVEALGRSPLRHAFHVVAVPVVNPDGVVANTRAHAAGRRATRRCNARGVDLNRNFPWCIDRLPLHPLSGSRLRMSPHFVGPAPLSEPESRAVHHLAERVVPRVSLAFHSTGGLLLYPYAHTDRPHPRRAEYEALGAAMRGAMRAPYEVKPSAAWYPVVGDLDDHLDRAHGTLAMTVEVGRVSAAAVARAPTDPFAWMNPVDPLDHVADAVAGSLALLERAADLVAPSALAAE